MKIITFANGTTKRITDEQERALIECSSTNAKHILIDGEIIGFAGIMRIMDENDYYEETGRERPQYDNYAITDFKQLSSPKEVYNKSRALRAIKSMRQGLINQIAQSEMTDKKQVLLNKMDARIELLENTPEDKIHLTSQNLVAGYF